jgi:calcium-dependent protein kinase
MDHPCICRLFETFEDEKKFYMVLENIDGRDLFEDIVARGRMSEYRAAVILQQVFRGLLYCHRMPVIHRDIKLENIMVMKQENGEYGEDPQIKLIDFGLAVCDSSIAERCRGSSGSRYGGTYSSPEARSGVCTAASDMWNTGVVLYILLSGVMPLQKVLDGEEILDFSGQSDFDDVSDNAKDLISNLIVVETEKRLTAAQALLHPWLQRLATRNISRKTLPGMISSFRSFHRGAMLAKAALTAVATQLTGRQIGELREQFLAADADGNGRISREEMENFLASMPRDCHAMDVDVACDSFFNSIDTDGSGEIEYTEWLAAAQHHLALCSDQAIRAAFRVFDIDCNGVISEGELARVIGHLDEDDIRLLLPEFDINGDGVLDYYEFKSMILNHSQMAGLVAEPAAENGENAAELAAENASCTSSDAVL